MAKQSNTILITEYHIALLQRAYFRWEDGGEEEVPSMDSKRPYGNSDVLGDLQEIYAELQGYELTELSEDWDTVSYYRKPNDELFRADAGDDLLWEQHRQMATVLQVLASNALTGIQPGGYSRKDSYTLRWTRDEDSVGQAVAEVEDSAGVEAAASEVTSYAPEFAEVKSGEIYELHSTPSAGATNALQAVIERVYGHSLDLLAASINDNPWDGTPNDSYILHDLRHSPDDSLGLEWDLRKFDAPSKLGPDEKPAGRTEMEYWQSLLPAEGEELTPELRNELRDYAPGLKGVLADLVRRGEIPAAKYLFFHSW